MESAYVYLDFYRLPYYGKGFSFRTVKTLEKSALEAFEYSLNVKPAQLSHFRSSLAEYSSRMDLPSPFYITHRMMTESLRELNLCAGSRSMQERPSRRPSSVAVDKVHAALLTGLSNLSEKFRTGYLKSHPPPIVYHIDDVQPDCPHFDAPRSTFLFLHEDSSGRSHVCRRPYPSIRQ